MLTQARLKELVVYEPTTGTFARLSSWKRTDRVGKRVGWHDKRGRLFISVDNHEYQAHRLAWLYMTGQKPPAIIDHKDGNPSNNAWANLREATNSQNLANGKKRSAPLKGITFDRSRPRRPWMAAIMKDYKRHHIGRFKTPEEAHAAYCAKARELFGEFARAD